MAVDIRWDLLTNASQNFGNSLMNAAGQVRQHRDTAAEANYLNNPNDPAAFKEAVRHNPGQALQIQDHHLEAARNLRADQAQQLDMIGQLLTRPDGTPINNDADYQQAVALARRAGIDVTGHETFDPAFVTGAVQLHQRLHPVAPIDAGPGHQLLDPQTGQPRGPGVPQADSVIPMTGGGYVVGHHNLDGSITITDQNGTIHYAQPATAAPASPSPPPEASPQDVIALNPQTGARLRLNPQTQQWEPIAAGGPASAPGNFPRQDGGAFDFRAHPPGG